MTSKVLVIIATSDKQKAFQGLKFATSALKNKWLDDVKIVFDGPSEELLVQDKKIIDEIKDMIAIQDIYACKAFSDKAKITQDIEGLGLSVEYVGSIISDYIKDGYIPMVW